MLCGGPAIHLFSATELERLVCGNPLLDFDAMQANARYDGGYSPEHRVRPASCLAPSEQLGCACVQVCADDAAAPFAWLLTVGLGAVVHGTQGCAANI